MALTLPKLALPKLAVPTLSLDKKQLPAIVGGVIVLAAAGWFGWQYFAPDAAPPPVSKPQAVTAVNQPAPAKAAAPADTGQARDKLIDDVLIATGLKQSLKQLPQRLVSGVGQAGKQQQNANPALIMAIEDALAESLTAEGIQGRLNADLKKRFDQTRLQALLMDYSTPAAKAMNDLQRASHAPQDLEKFARSAAANRPTPERAGLIKRIDAATKASDLAVEIAFVTMKALALGIAGEGTGKAAAVDKTIEKQRAATTRKIRDAALLDFAFNFKDVSDADLAKYAAIYETENSKWLFGLVNASLLEEVKVASSEAGKLIGKLAIKPATGRTRLAGSKAGADARTCLSLPTNAAIIQCAEDYR